MHLENDSQISSKVILPTSREITCRTCILIRHELKKSSNVEGFHCTLSKMERHDRSSYHSSRTETKPSDKGRERILHYGINSKQSDKGHCSKAIRATRQICGSKTYQVHPSCSFHERSSQEDLRARTFVESTRSIGRRMAANKEHTRQVPEGSRGREDP